MLLFEMGLAAAGAVIVLIAIAWAIHTSKKWWLKVTAPVRKILGKKSKMEDRIGPVHFGTGSAPPYLEDLVM